MKRIYLLTYILCLIQWTTFAQTADHKKAKAREIIDKYIEAIGGQERLDKVKSWRLEGKAIIGEGMKPSAKYLIKGNKIRIETSMAGQTNIQAYDGTTAWNQTPFSNQGRPKRSAFQKLDAATYTTMVLPVQLLGKYRNEATYDGIETIKGKDVHVVSCLKNKNKRTYYFDSQTFLLFKRKVGTLFSTEFMAYEKDAQTGLHIPGKVKTTGLAKMILTKIKVNPHLPDALFAFKEVKATPDKYQKLMAEGKEQPADKSLTAANIATKYAQVRQKLNKYQNVQVKGKMIFKQNGMNFPMVIYFEKEQKSRFEVNMGAVGNMILVSNGNDQWELATMIAKKPRRLTGKDKNTLFALSDGDLAEYKARGYTIKYLAKISIGGKPCHKIQLKKNGQSSLYYIDAENFSLRKISQGKEKICYLNYAPTNGLMLPKAVYLQDTDGQHLVFEMKNYIFDRPVDERIFEFPEE